MIADKEFKISLDFILPKIKIGAFDYYGTEFDHLAHVYFCITELAMGKGKVLSKGCSGCIPGAVHIVKNYLLRYPIVEEVKVQAELTLKEMRVLHPTIKATSRKSFIRKIEENGN
jgi:hypothetical protein